MQATSTWLVIGAAAVVLVTSATLAPPTDGAPSAPVALRAVTSHPDGDPINGRRVFLRENCYICHGGRAGGGMCPSLREDPPNESDVRHVIEDGTESGMPSFRGRVNEQEIADLAAYFDTLRSAQEPTFTHWWEPGVPTR